MNKSNAHLYLPLVQALAEGKLQYNCGSHDDPAWEDVITVMWSGGLECYRIKPTPFPPKPEGTEWHNPDGLTAEQVGDGWRLLTAGEVREGSNGGKECYSWLGSVLQKWSVLGFYAGDSNSLTYRVPISTPFPDGSYLKDGQLVKPWTLTRHITGFRPLRDGEEWHRTDWTEEMLEGGWRPLLSTEVAVEGIDQVWWLFPPIETVKWKPCDGSWADAEEAAGNAESSWLRTNRPLPVETQTNETTQYRRLNEGEIIQDGDEVYDDEKKTWRKDLRCIGKPAPNPIYTSHREYRRPLPEPPKLVPWDDTGDFPKVPTIWIRSKNDYRDHLVIGFANPCAIITASCGCQPVLESIHLTQDGVKDMEWSEDRKDWLPCSKTA